MKTFQKGDMVVLKSGNHIMIVENIQAEKGLWCIWVVGKDKCGDWFDPATVDIVTDFAPVITNMF